MAKPISETLKMFQGGDFNVKAGELFAAVLRGVEDTETALQRPATTSTS